MGKDWQSLPNYKTSCCFEKKAGEGALAVLEYNIQGIIQLWVCVCSHVDNNHIHYYHSILIFTGLQLEVLEEGLGRRLDILMDGGVKEGTQMSKLWPWAQKQCSLVDLPFRGLFARLAWLLYYLFVEYSYATLHMQEMTEWRKYWIS